MIWIVLVSAAIGWGLVFWNASGKWPGWCLVSILVWGVALLTYVMVLV
jgi:hypothetical protein